MSERACAGGRPPQVFAAYCSSDAWVGNTDDASAETFGFVFRGQRILRAILGALVGIHQLGQRPGHRLLLAGCSAGARGAMFNLDYIPGILEEFKVAYPVQVRRRQRGPRFTPRNAGWRSPSSRSRAH